MGEKTDEQQLFISYAIVSFFFCCGGSVNLASPSFFFDLFFFKRYIFFQVHV